MNNETEVLTTTNELVKVVDASGVEPQTASMLRDKFLPFFEKAEEWKQKASTLNVTDISQTREMQMARQARLALREIRTSADKTRKELKEDSLRYGKAVQGVYNVIEFLIAPIEKHLENQERFAEIHEAKRKAELKAKREMELQPFAEFVPFGIDLSIMSDEDFSKTLNGAKLQQQAKVDAAAKAEAELFAKAKAEQEERERVRIENEKLKAEAAEKEKQFQAERAKAEAERKAVEVKAKKEREAAEAKLKAEKDANEKLQAEIRAKAEAERKAVADAEKKEQEELKAKQLAEKKAKAAPDKAKLIELAKLIDSISFPELKSEDGQKILIDAKGLLVKVSNFIREKSATI